MSKNWDEWEKCWAEWQVVRSWSCFLKKWTQFGEAIVGNICFLSLQQHWKVYWNNPHLSFPNRDCSELQHVFSKESWIDTKSHMSGIISKPFINRPRLGRAHLRLLSVFLGWAPRLPDSWTIMCSFHDTLCIYFTEACAFYPFISTLKTHLCPAGAEVQNL